MIERNAALARSPRLAWNAIFDAPVPDGPFVDHPSSTGSMTLRRGENFDGPTGLAIAAVEAGTISLEVTTASGIQLCLRQLGPGDIVVPLDLIASPAFSLAYRSEGGARLSWLRNRATTPSRAVELERMMLDATIELLGACIRMIHELACLPAPHRLYCELLRMAAQAGEGTDGTTLARFVLPRHADLAVRLCTTRETISRELSFLRRNGVIAPGKVGEILNPDFLLSRIASTLNLANVADVWATIRAGPAPSTRP